MGENICLTLFKMFLANSFAPRTLNPIAGFWLEVLTVSTSQTAMDCIGFQRANSGCFIQNMCITRLTPFSLRPPETFHMCINVHLRSTGPSFPVVFSTVFQAKEWGQPWPHNYHARWSPGAFPAATFPGHVVKGKRHRKRRSKGRKRRRFGIPLGDLTVVTMGYTQVAIVPVSDALSSLQGLVTSQC